MLNWMMGNLHDACSQLCSTLEQSQKPQVGLLKGFICILYVFLTKNSNVESFDFDWKIYLMIFNSQLTTVDGWNPAPPGMVQKNPINNGKNYLSTGAGFQPSTVWFHWDMVFHPSYIIRSTSDGRISEACFSNAPLRIPPRKLTWQLKKGLKFSTVWRCIAY